MAKISQSRKAVDTNWVLEDPRPSSSTIYIQGDAHDHTSLAPIFAKSSTTLTSGSQTSQIGKHNHNNTEITCGQPFTSLVLTKGSTSVRHGTTTTSDGYANLDMQWLQSIDPAYIPNGVAELNNGITKSIWYWNINTVRFGFGEIRTFQGYTNNQELFDIIPSSGINFATDAGGTDGSAVRSIIPWVGSSNRVPYIAQYNGRMDINYYPSSFRLGYLTYPNIQTLAIRTFSTFNIASLSLDSWWGQFLGTSTSGDPLFFVTNTTNDNQIKVVNYNISANTTSYLYEWSTERSASDGAAGGTRSQTTGIRRQVRFASTFFNDPNVANTKGFYVPYFDINNNYQPYYFQWNTTNNTFTQNSDVLVVSETVNNTFAPSSSLLNDLTALVADDAGMSAVVFNETFVSNSKRYLMLGALNGVYGANDSADNKRTFIIYEIHSASPKTLIYHSHLIFPTTPKNLVWLNDSKTLMGVFLDSAFKIYNFTTVTGWVESQSIAEKFWAVGRDRSDRIWGASQSAIDSYTELHLITPTIPITINIVPELSTYNYQGSTINSYFTLEAINAQGNRVVTDVTLVIDGSTMTFSDNTKSKIVTTSDSATVQVNIKVIDSGFSQIIASVTV